MSRRREGKGGNSAKRRKLICFIATSLDGFIAGPRGEIDWLFHDADYGFKDFYRSVDTVVMGRKTWGQALKLEKQPFADKTVYVFSRKTRGRSHPGATVVAGGARRFMERMRRAPGRDIWLVGGGELARPFFQAGLVDRLVISIHPVALGKGIPLFHDRSTWSLRGCRGFPSGLVQLTYDSRRRA